MSSAVFELQAGYTKHPCILCLWDSGEDDRHNTLISWPSRTRFTHGLISNLSRSSSAGDRHNTQISWLSRTSFSPGLMSNLLT